MKLALLQLLESILLLTLILILTVGGIYTYIKISPKSIALPDNVFITDFQMPMTIEMDTDFSDLLYSLRVATEDDTITIRNTGYGGTAIRGIALANAIEDSLAKVIVEVSGGAYSAHAVIACAADEIIFQPNSFLMYHTLQMPTPRGYVPILYPEADIDQRLMLDRMATLCVGKTMTLDQWDEIVFTGLDLYVTGEL